MSESMPKFLPKSCETHSQRTARITREQVAAAIKVMREKLEQLKIAKELGIDITQILK